MVKNLHTCTSIILQENVSQCVWRILYDEELYRLHKDTDPVPYMPFTRLQWAGVSVFETRVSRRILEGSFGGRGPTVKLRSRWEDEIWESAAKLLSRETCVQ